MVAFALGIALPEWLVSKENTSWVLLIYGLVFGVAMPYYVSKWWSSSRIYTKQKIMTVTMARFYPLIKENITLKKLVEILCLAEEFKEVKIDTETKAYKQMEAKVKEELKKRVGEVKISNSLKAEGVDWQDKVLVLLYAHLFRIRVETLDFESGKEKEEWMDAMEYIIEKSVRLCSGVLQICMSHGWLNIIMMVLDMEQVLSLLWGEWY